MYLSVCSQHHCQSKAAWGVLPCLSRPHPGHSARSRWGENTQWPHSLFFFFLPPLPTQERTASVPPGNSFHRHRTLIVPFSHFFHVSSVCVRGQQPGWDPPGDQGFETNSLTGSHDLRLLLPWTQLTWKDSSSHATRTYFFQISPLPVWSGFELKQS